MLDDKRKEYIYFLTLVDRLKEGNWTKQDEEVIEEHVHHLIKLKEEGVILLAGKTQTSDDLAVGLCIFYAKDLEEAKEIAESDPAVRYGIMKYDLQEYKTAVKAF